MKQIIKMALLGSALLTFTAINAHAIQNSYMHGQGGFKGNAINAREMIHERQQYQFRIDTSNDVFVNPQAFSEATGGMQFVDENGDGICDIAQDSPRFEALQVGAFVDNNSDGIHDRFQTREFYQQLKMDNYVDVDGDGICDNYEQNPIEEE
jgi:hypothetical protein